MNNKLVLLAIAAVAAYFLWKKMQEKKAISPGSY